MRTFGAAASVICILAAMWSAPSRAECLVEEQLSNMEFAAINRAAELATQIKPLLGELEQINEKAKDPSRPIGPQLSTHDLARFSELRQRLMAIQLQQLLESGYGRDYKVVGNLFALMQKLYIGEREPSQGDPNSKSYGIILLMRYAATSDDFKGVDEISVPTKIELEQCDLVAALHLVENESLTKLNQLPVKESSQKLLELRAKNPSPSGKIDRSKLNPQDGAIYDSIMRNTMAPANHEITFIGDVEDLKSIVKAADLRFQANKKDAIDLGGDANAVGQTLSKANLDKRMTFGIGILNAIAEAFPSEWVQQQKEMQNIIQQIPGAQSQKKK